MGKLIYAKGIQIIVSALSILGLMAGTLSPALAASAAHPHTPSTNDLDSSEHYTLDITITDQKPEPAPKPAAALTKFVVNYNPPGDCAVNTAVSGVPNFIRPLTTTAWSQAAKDAFEEALAVYELLLTIDGTITINACMMDYSSSTVIATTQPVSVFPNFTNAPIANTLYPVALANQLSGSDLNDNINQDHDSDGDPDANAEIAMAFNSNGGVNWYYGLDGNPGGGQIDFVTTAVHEIGHGLGFVSSLFVNNAGDIPDFGDICNTTDSNDGKGCWGLSTGFPFIYDRFVYNTGGDQLIDTGKFANPSVALGQALTGTLVFSGTNAKAANSGISPVLYAPDPFEPGGSVLHLDEATYTTLPDNIFTPIATNGQSQHHPGPIALGILEDIGWNAVSLPDITFTKTASSSSVEGGTVLTYTLTVKNTGYTLAKNVQITDVIPISMTLDASSLSGDGSSPGGTSPGNTITWDTEISLTTNSTLSRTFVVSLDSDLTGVSSINNTAYVTTTVGVGDNDSVSVNVSGGSPGSGGIYLPIILVSASS